MIVIGDVHGKFREYEILCNRFPGVNTVQIGDMGVGFPLGRKPKFRPMYDRFFRGNHDNPAACKEFGFSYMGDGGSYDMCGTKFFFIPGAWSIDWQLRVEGRDWWSDEQLPQEVLDEVIELYKFDKPDIVLSHDAPAEVARALLSRYKLKGEPPATIYPTRTGQALQAMFEAHQPRQWIFGHYHMDWTKEIKGTKFRCLNELSWTEV